MKRDYALFIFTQNVNLWTIYFFNFYVIIIKLIVMFNWTLEYTMSQVLTVIVYILLCSTYFLKNRNKILVTNILVHIVQAASFLLLNGLTGFAMCLYIFSMILFLLLMKRIERVVSLIKEIILFCSCFYQS